MESPTRPPFARPSANDPYLAALRERVLIYDGATGTNFQLQDLHADDFGGAALEGCNEILVVTKPDAVEALHRSFLDVGVDVIETDSFGAFSVVLAEYGIAERSHELAMVSAQIARRVADSYASPGSPRFVAARWARAPSSRRSVRSPTTTFRPVTKRWPSDSSRAASTS